MLAAAVTKLSKVSKVKKFDDVLSDLKQTGKFVKNSDIVIKNPTNKTIIGSALNSEKIFSNTSSINSKIVKNPYDILKQHKIPINKGASGAGGKYSAFGEMSETDGIKYRDWNYEKIHEIFIHNLNADSMTLGKSFDGTI